MILTPKRLRLLATFLAFSGLLGLFALELLSEPKQIEISSLSEEFEGKKVKLQARPQNVFVSKSTLFFDLYENGSKIRAVKFNPTEEEVLLLKQSIFVEVTGKLQLFKGEPEVIALEVKKIA